MNYSRTHIEEIVREVLREVEQEEHLVEKNIRKDAIPGDFVNFVGRGMKKLASSWGTMKRQIDQELEFPASADAMREATPARIFVGRRGTRYKTKVYLDFQASHAAAKDAVLGEVPKELVQKLNLLELHTLADTKEKFIADPGLGRHLNEESKKILVNDCQPNVRLQILVIDGLSSTAIEKNMTEMLGLLNDAAKHLGITVPRGIFVRHGRVAVINEIGEILKPEVALAFVGERPGLVTAESMGAYLTYRPGMNTTEAERCLVSNIHRDGTVVGGAAEKIAALLVKIYAQKKSGVALE